MGIFSNVDEILNSVKKGDLDEMINKTKNYAEVAAQKSAERLEISKKKIELLDSKTKLVKAYERLGKLQFSIYEGNEVNQDELDAVIEEIQLYKSRSEYLDDEVEVLKDKFKDALSKNGVDFSTRINNIVDMKNKSNDIEVTVVEPDEE